jgi:hypothetical protein
MNRFVLGIGSQRAGSTLLHHALEASTDVFMHPLKELHYFDTLHGVRAPEALRDFSLRQLSREIDRIVGSKELDFLDARYRCYLRANRILGMSAISEVNYLDLFRPFVARSPLLGEVTPEYMLLGDDGIRAMKDVVGEDAVVILICRNPVKRVLSAVKLMSTYNGLNLDDQSAREWLLRMLETPNPWMQAQDGYNDYVGTITRYSAHFRRVIAIGYDRLATDPDAVAKSISALGEFRVDRDAFVAATKEQKNDLGPGFNVGTDVESLLLERYGKQLHAAQEHLGIELSR